MLRKKIGRKALCILTAVCLIATGFSMAGPEESYAADNTQAQYLGKIDVTGVSVKENSRYGSSTTYDEEFYKEIMSGGYDAAYTTEETALEIRTAGQLAAFAKAVNEKRDFNDKYVKLANDIKLEGTKPDIKKEQAVNDPFTVVITGTLDKVWTPIGSSKEHAFKGTFDGGKNKITNMVVCEKAPDSSYAGLFGYVDGSTIRNLGIEEACVISDNDDTSNSYVGGLAGHSNHSTITSCHAAAYIYAKSDNASAVVYTGGLVGLSDGGNTITGCYGVGNFYVFGQQFAAGALVGQNIASKITRCYGAGAVYASSTHTNTDFSSAGGLVGRNTRVGTDKNSAVIENCHAASNICTFKPNGKNVSCAGGLVGYNDARITSCYATGDVLAFDNGTANAGSLVGWNFPGVVQTSYQNKEAKVIAIQGSGGGTITGDCQELNRQQMTGTGTGRAKEMMEGFDQLVWTFKPDDPTGDHLFNCYFPRLAGMDYSNPGFSQTIYSVTVTPGKGMAMATDSGAATQSVFASDNGVIYMKPIIYTADSGHTFPEDYVSKCTIPSGSGITVTRNSKTQITISGTPAADTTINLADALPPAPPVTQPSGSYYCTLTADALAFPDLQAGDTPQSQPLQLHCSGNTGATITKVELSSADFLLDDSKAEAYVGAGKTNSTYQITPKAGLSPGSYKAKVIVTYGYGQSAEADITLTVTEAEQAAPSKLTAKSKSYRTIALSWEKAERAEKYQVYRASKKTGAYKRISTTSKTALNNIRLTTGKTYYYKVRAYRTVNGKKIYSPFTGIASAKPKPSAPSFSLKAGKGKITASWKSVSGATGYQIYRASAKNGKFVLVKDSRGKTKSYTSAKLRSGKTYYYKLRAYRVVSGKKIYSSYTKVKNIKTK